MFVAEPAASVVYLSPRQLAAGADTVARYIIAYARKVKALLHVPQRAGTIREKADAFVRCRCE